MGGAFAARCSPGKEACGLGVGGTGGYIIMYCDCVTVYRARALVLLAVVGLCIACRHLRALRGRVVRLAAASLAMWVVCRLRLGWPLSWRCRGEN